MVQVMGLRKDSAGLACLIVLSSFTATATLTQCAEARSSWETKNSPHSQAFRLSRKLYSTSDAFLDSSNCINPPLNPLPPSTSPPPRTLLINPPPPHPLHNTTPHVFLPPIVYPPPSAPPPHHSSASPKLWCVAKPTVPDPIIQEALDYACGFGSNCTPIQRNGSCYQPDTVVAHASFAFNNYWQRKKMAGGTCDFGGTAMLITTDPSYDGCNFNI